MNQEKLLSEYSSPTHFVETIYLTIDINDDVTKVISKQKIIANSKNPSSQITLDGENQKLISVKLNNDLLTENDYKLTAASLTILKVPESFELIIETEIKPQENTSLSGLYKSGNMFCTQCESEGFRRITYYLDRPDVLSSFTTKIIADKNKYPVLLSNGNLIETNSLDHGLHYAIWNDPFKKPAYLFAMVAGNLDYVDDHFTTMSDRDVTIRIYSEKGNQDKCKYALKSLKKAMQWDEENYGREYDLDIYMIVAVHDLNFGAMENKGLNIFNSKYIFVDPKTATDTDYSNVDGVVAHEYFHNWTGNRVTLRDWFHICLKEGLTSFRDQSFSESIESKAVARIDQVQILRSYQFPEDASPLAHPIRPESYIEINNFYTVTVYEKGAEIIRMLKNIVGPENYRRGTDLYFECFDGKAVICEDFLSAIADAAKMDLSQFKLWYSQAGTPELTIATDFNEQKQEYTVNIEQFVPDTPGQKNKKPMLIPVKIGLIDNSGIEICEKTLLLSSEKEKFIFSDIKQKPIPSILRDFSAPVKIKYNYTDTELAFLMQHDNNGYAKWEAGQIYTTKILLDLINEKISTPPQEIFTVFESILNDKNDLALTSQILVLPTEKYLAEQTKIIDVDKIHSVREELKKALAKTLHTQFKKCYESIITLKPYQYNTDESAKRRLKNTCLSYLVLADEIPLAVTQFNSADNMTDQLAAFSAIVNIDCNERNSVIESFYKQYQNDPLVIDKWFAIQAMSSVSSAINDVKRLLQHKDFHIKNPNRVRSLLGAFAANNSVYFHDVSGVGYELLTKYILKIDPMNPMLASRLIEPFSNWQRYDKIRQDLMKAQLEKIIAIKDLSKHVSEIVNKLL